MRLIQEERSRPIDDQFPFVAADIDKINTALEKTQKSLESLIGNVKNNSDEMEANARICFMNWLEKEGYTDVFHDTAIADGVIFDSSLRQIVQWDGIISAVNPNDHKTHLFLLEVKQFPSKHIFAERQAHDMTATAEDLPASSAATGDSEKRQAYSGLKPRRTLALKIERTLRFLRETLPDHRTKNFGAHYKRHLDLWNAYATVDVSFAYVSGLMRENVKGALRDLPTSMLRLNPPLRVDVLFVECLRYGSCSVSRVSAPSP